MSYGMFLESPLPTAVQRALARARQLKRGERLETRYTPTGPIFKVVRSTPPAPSPAPAARPPTSPPPGPARDEPRLAHLGTAGSYGYLEVPSDRVAHRLRREAEHWVAFLSRCERVPRPTLRWFRPASPRERPDFRRRWPTLGLADRARGEIWLLSESTPARIAELVAHEIRHLAGGFESEAREAEREVWRFVPFGVA